MKKSKKNKKKESSKTKKILIYGAIIIVIIAPLLVIYLTLKDGGKNKEKEEVNFTESNEIEEYFSENKILIDFVDANEKTITSFNSLDNRSKISIALSALMAEGNDIYEEGIEVDDMEDYFKDAFYEKIKWEKEDYDCEDWCNSKLYLYDTKTNSYIYNPNHGGHGGSSTASPFYSKTIDLYKEGTTYTITKVKLWNNYDNTYEPVPWDLYDSYDSIINKTPLKEIKCPYIDEYGQYEYKCDDVGEKERIEVFNENFDEYKDNMDKYIYTIEKVGDDFKLKTFEYKNI